MFSGLSLVLNKEVCDWTRQTLNLSELIGERPAKPDLIHTSCRSESSNISLVVLDKLSFCSNATQARLKSVMHFPRKHSELVKLFCLSPGFTPSGRSPTCLSPQTWWGYVLDPWTVKNTETTSCSDPTTAGHLSGEIGTNSPLTPSLPSFHHH